MISFLELLLGHPIRIASYETSSGDGSANTSITYQRSTSYTETEQMQFSARGSVHTADGQNISFQVNLGMNRYFHTESMVSSSIGNATDPLVLNFSGHATTLTDSSFAFDLNTDGSEESIPFVGQGSGILVFDRNGDNVASDGSELFGPNSGNGFNELAALDSDHNGWIDENDDTFSQLKLWIRSADGKNELRSLLAANVGTISIANVASPFQIKDENNVEQGKVVASGIFLQETCEIGTIQQINLVA